MDRQADGMFVAGLTIAAIFALFFVLYVADVYLVVRARRRNRDGRR